jgi:hypothetical protein
LYRQPCRLHFHQICEHGDLGLFAAPSFDNQELMLSFYPAAPPE